MLKGLGVVFEGFSFWFFVLEKNGQHFRTFRPRCWIIDRSDIGNLAEISDIRTPDIRILPILGTKYLILLAGHSWCHDIGNSVNFLYRVTWYPLLIPISGWTRYLDIKTRYRIFNRINTRSDIQACTNYLYRVQYRVQYLVFQYWGTQISLPISGMISRALESRWPCLVFGNLAFMRVTVQACLA